MAENGWYIIGRNLTALAAKPKHLKSFAALDMAEAICQGHDVFDSFKVNRPGPVVYLGMEDGKFEIANRLLKRGLKAGDPHELYIGVTRIPLGTAAGIRELEFQIANIKPVLVIVDTAREALGIKDWADASELVEKMRLLRDFAREHCTILLIAHNRKAEGSNGDEISGSNAFTSCIDGWLSCSRKDVQPNGNVRLTINREGRGDLRGELAIEMNTETLHFTALSEVQVADSKRKVQVNQGISKGDHRYSVLELMADTNSKATSPWITSQLNISDRTSQNLLQQMTKENLIEDSLERVGNTGRTIVYQITAAGQSEIRKAEFSPRDENNAAYSDYIEDEEDSFEEHGFEEDDFNSSEEAA